MEQGSNPIVKPQQAMAASGRRNLSIGLPASSDEGERRFPLTPESVQLLVEAGYEVKMQSGASAPIHYIDNQYAHHGARVVARDEALRCDIVIHLASLSAHEVKKMRRGAMLLSLLPKSKEMVEALVENHITAIAIELVTDEGGNQTIADILAVIDGRAAIVTASSLLVNAQEGKGILLGGVAGVVPCEVTILGSGIAACAAARSAVGLGAIVRMFDNDVCRLRRAMQELGAGVIGSALLPQVLRNALRSADVVVSTPMRSPHHISRDEVAVMKRRAIVFDLGYEGENPSSVAIEIVDLSRHNAADYLQQRVCFVNVGQTVPRTAAMALSNALVTMLGDVDNGSSRMSATHLRQGMSDGAYVYMGKVVNKSIAGRFGMRYVDISLLTQLS